MEEVVIARRLTVFISESVKCDTDNRKKLGEAFPGAYIGYDASDAKMWPISEVFPMEDEERWTMTTSQPETKEYMFHFGNRRIDLTSADRKKEEETKVIERMSKRMTDVLAVLGIDSVRRMAYCPTIAIDDGVTFSSKMFFDDKLSLPEVEGSKPYVRSLTAIYRINKDVGGKNRAINLSCRLTEGCKRDGKGNVLGYCLIAEMDINTLIEEDTTYFMGDIRAFASNAWKWSGEIIKLIVR